MNKSFGYVSVIKAMPISFMKTSWLFQLANKNSLCFDGILISANLLRNRCYLLIIVLILCIFFSCAEFTCLTAEVGFLL